MLSSDNEKNKLDQFAWPADEKYRFMFMKNTCHNTHISSFAKTKDFSQSYDTFLKFLFLNHYLYEQEPFSFQQQAKYISKLKQYLVFVMQ